MSLIGETRHRAPPGAVSCPVFFHLCDLKQTACSSVLLIESPSGTQCIVGGWISKTGMLPIWFWITALAVSGLESVFYYTVGDKIRLK